MGRLSERRRDMRFPYGTAFRMLLFFFPRAGRRRLIRHVAPRRRSVTLMDMRGTKRAHERRCRRVFVHTSGQIRWGGARTNRHANAVFFFFFPDKSADRLSFTVV